MGRGHCEVGNKIIAAKLIQRQHKEVNKFSEKKNTQNFFNPGSAYQARV
jgi:nucleoside diphosphate kinase